MFAYAFSISSTLHYHELKQQPPPFPQAQGVKPEAPLQPMHKVDYVSSHPVDKGLLPEPLLDVGSAQELAHYGLPIL